jgi:hypothetical protein
MMLRGAFHLVVGFVFLAMFQAVPAWADKELDEQIKALEKEVAKIEPLKDQLEKLKEQQIELKKEATAAAAEMPTFQYRPGRGLTIAAADKSWSLNTTYRINMYIYNMLNGKSNFGDEGEQRNTGVTNAEIFPRRNRLYMNYCWHDCFYAFEYSIDGETAERQASVRDNEFYVHFDQWNPYLPYFSIGLRRGAGRTHVSRSSDNDGKMEHSIILDGFNWGGDGSHAGAGLGWEGVDVGPGEVDLFLNFASSRQGTHQEFVNDNRKGIMLFAGARPFANLKNKWISGLELGFGYQGQSLDRPENSLDDTGGTEIRVRSVERRGRQDLFRPSALGQGTVNCDDENNDAGSGDCSAQNVGAGWGHVFIPGMKWVVGPYMFRAVWLKTQYKNRNTDPTDELRGAGIFGKGWTIDHQLMLWSPKGFLTGSQTTPNTLMASFGFERADMDCGRGCDASPGGGSFHRQTVLNREAALWWWFEPSLGVGVWWHYWTAHNTPIRTQVAVGCKDDISSADSGKGAGRKCSWHSVNTGLRWRW